MRSILNENTASICNFMQILNCILTYILSKNTNRYMEYHVQLSHCDSKFRS